MATHPYISGPGNVAQMVTQLRKSFPSTISSETVKKLGLAPNNESYVINVLQFIGVIDSEGKKTPEAAKAFSHHKDEDFSAHFGALVQKAYSSLFELHGNDAWNLDSDELITFFRQSDQTSATIGGRPGRNIQGACRVIWSWRRPGTQVQEVAKSNCSSEGRKRKRCQEDSTARTTRTASIDRR